MESGCINIIGETRKNDDFRKVLFTRLHSQIAVMAIKPEEELGFETNLDTDIFIYIFEGCGKAFLESKETQLDNNMAIFIPAGVEYNLVNFSRTDPLKFYCVSSPPEYPDGCIHKTKIDELNSEGE
jgi:mannose-6-phosphate isomerase-like protein (cupin superfamily)